MTITELITEYQAKIDEIRFDMPTHEKMGGGKYYRHKLGMYEEFVRKLKEADASRWIPTSKRLPEIGSEVLVCYDFKGSRSVYISNFYGDDKFHGLDDEYLTSEGRKYRKVVAWQLLPEPYKGKEET